MKSFIFIPILIFSLHAFAQEQNSLKSIINSYEAFNYVDVIRKSEQAISNKGNYSDKELIDIYMLKGISHYSISEELNAQKCFIEILKLHSEYSPDPAAVSPKIISLFNTTKETFIKIRDEQLNENKKLSDNSDSLLTIKIQLLEMNNSTYKRALTKSLLLPGWGHFELNQETKGWVLSSLSVASLATMIYYIFDTNSKEKEYLSEANESLIREKYNSYNSSYRIRNLSIILFSAIWSYSQFDIIFFQNTDLGNVNNNALQLILPTDLSLGININF
jgi:hypothetical protein